MKMKKLLALLLVFAMAAALFAGCNGKPEATEPTATTDTTTAPTEDDGENYDTGDASLDNPRNQDEIGENELLVVSFGTSYNDNRRLTIGAIEAAMEKAFPEYSVRRGFTSQIIIDHVKDRDGEIIDNVGEALDRAVANGVKNLVIQPTHLMNGLEYNDLVNEVAQYSDAFESVAIGLPLLTSDEDFQIVADAIVKATASYDDGKTAICFMGHGTEAESNAVYAKMQQMLTDAGHTNYFVGTVEASPTLEEVLAAVQAGDYTKVVLRPLMNMRPFGGMAPEGRSAALAAQVLPTGTGKLESGVRKIADFVLDGNCAVLCDGCAQAVLAEMPGFASRAVDQPPIESAAFAPHEAFNETIRTNLTLLHRILRTPDFVTEILEIGDRSWQTLSQTSFEVKRINRTVT